MCYVVLYFFTEFYNWNLKYYNGESARQTTGAQQVLRINKQEEELEFTSFPSKEGE